MLIYWLLFFYCFVLSISKFNFEINKIKIYSFFFCFFYFFLTLIIGLRSEVGGDWYHYLKFIEIAKHQPLSEHIFITDPSYAILNWLSSNLNLGPYFVNLVCAALFSYGLIYFAKAQTQPWLVLLISIPYLVIVVAMGYTRQSVAISFAMIGLVFLQNGKILKFILFLFLAITFHKSAFILLTLAFLSGRKKFFTFIGIILLGCLLYFILISEHIDNLISGYIVDQYDSSGASIRVLMNVFPGFLFILFRNRFNLNVIQKNFWTLMAISSFLLLFLLFISPSSTAVDRLALYWIPLQLFVLSRIPQALSSNFSNQIFILLIISLYLLAILFIWLFFADNRYYWIPYKFYPLEFLWK